MRRSQNHLRQSLCTRFDLTQRAVDAGSTTNNNKREQDWKKEEKKETRQLVSYTSDSIKSIMDEEICNVLTCPERRSTQPAIPVGDTACQFHLR